jgi:hypothetical protein
MLMVVVLPAPFGRQETEDFAGLDCEVDAAHRLDVAVFFDEARDLDDAHR